MLCKVTQANFPAPFPLFQPNYFTSYSLPDLFLCLLYCYFCLEYLFFLLETQLCIHICIQPPSLQRLSGKCGFQPASLRSTGRCPGRNCWVPNDHIQPHFPYFNIWDLLNPPTWLLINKHWLGKRALSPPRFPPPSFLQGDGRIVDSELRFGKWKQEQAWIIE